MGYLAQALVFLVQTLFGLYLIVLLLRLLMQLSRADFHNPIARVITQASNPLLRPLRRVIPGYGGIDWALIVLTLVIQIAELIITSVIVSGAVPGIAALTVMAIGRLLQLVIYIYIVVILIEVILSWVNPHAYNAATILVYSLSTPIMRPARRLIPPMGGIDLSPLVVLIVLNLLLILLVAPILDTAHGLAVTRGP